MHRALAESIHLFETGLESCHRPEDRVLVGNYLAVLAPMLADTVLGKDVLHRLRPMERLLGHTWLQEEAPFEGALAKWREFRAEYKSWALRVLTVNERLSALQLVAAFDQAVASKDVNAITGILVEAEVPRGAIDAIARSHAPDA